MTKRLEGERREMIRLKRAYENPSPEDGERILVERLWPRGVTRERAALDGWFKELAPSPELRRWYEHRIERWSEFRARYREELAAPDKQPLLGQLLQRSTRGTVTLVFAAKDPEHSSASVLKDWLETEARLQG